MIGRVALSIALVACGGAPLARPKPVSERCAMVDAAFQLDQLKKFACGTAATRDHRILVEVDMAPPFTETCSSSVFAIYKREEPTNTDAVLQLGIGTPDHGQTWHFSAVFFDPPNSPDDEPPNPDGSFDDINYYCALGGGRLTKTNGVWRSWEDPNW